MKATRSRISIVRFPNLFLLCRCDTPIKGIQPVPKIYVCAHEGTRHSLNGCRKSYLNFLGLDQHQKLRYISVAVGTGQAHVTLGGHVTERVKLLAVGKKQLFTDFT